jgi:hypothetical protein
MCEYLHTEEIDQYIEDKIDAISDTFSVSSIDTDNMPRGSVSSVNTSEGSISTEDSEENNIV